jgi:hypothetical protein
LAWSAFFAGLSVWHRKALAVFFPDQPGSLIKRLVIAQRRIADAREWAAASFDDTLLRWSMKLAAVHQEKKKHIKPQFQA